jgi:hypothetical protein
MSKISLDEVESTLLRQKIEPAKVSAIIQDLKQVIEEVANDKDATPKQKWEHLIVLNDTSKEFKGKELTGWVVQQIEGDDAGLVFSKLQDAAKNQNEGATKKKNLIQSTADIFAHVKSKFLKEKNIRIKTKEPVRVLIA